MGLTDRSMKHRGLQYNKSPINCTLHFPQCKGKAEQEDILKLEIIFMKMIQNKKLVGKFHIYSNRDEC